MSSSLSRRMFLGRSARTAAGLAVLGTSASLLAACGDDSSSGSSGGSDLGTLNFQLSWIKNVEFAGEYIADTSGYYKKAGFSSVNLISGGPNVSQDAVVAAGKALIGISSPDITAAAALKGGGLVIIGAQYQKNPFAIMSLTSKPINKPEDMIGKKIGVQATNEPVWNAFLKANKIDAGKVTKVPAQFDPTPLVNKEVDGWFSFFTNEPNLLKVKGIDTTVMLLNDNGYPMVSETYMVRKDSLSKKRDALKAVLKADAQGWADAIKDPTLGAKLAVTKYGKTLGLEEKEQGLEAAAENTVISTADTKTNGLFTITDQLLDETIATLKLAGVSIKKDELFDMSVLKELYDENPDLKTIG